MSKKGFTPDVRSFVGRKLIVDDFIAHRTRLDRIKSSVDCGAPSSIMKRRIAPRKAPTVTEERHIEQVRGMFDRLETVRSSIDTSVPKTLQQARQISGRHKRREETEMRDHAYNIAHMQRRMLDAYTVTERKKNVYDPSCYPALLLRRPVDIFSIPLNVTQSGSGLSTSMSSTRSRPVSRQPRSSGQTSPRGFASSRSASVGVAQRSYGESTRDSSTRYRRPATAADYLLFKQHLVDTIVSNRLYTAEDLNEFFAAADAAHPYLDRRMKLSVIEEIRHELELPSSNGQSSTHGDGEYAYHTESLGPLKNIGRAGETTDYSRDASDEHTSHDGMKKPQSPRVADEHGIYDDDDFDAPE